MRKNFSQMGLLLMLAVFATYPLHAAIGVLTVPWVATSPLSPHYTYPCAGSTATALCSGGESTVVLGAIVTGAAAGDSFNVDWNFGDGSTDATFTTTNAYDISTTHNYPSGATNGTAWTATVTVTDTTNPGVASGNYYLIQSKNNLQARVNVAIDWGLWYMHQTEWRNTSGAVNIGGWDNLIHPCNTPSAGLYDCTGNAVINAENVQAFEVSGHTASGPAADPYTDDVARGLARMFMTLSNESNVRQTYQFDPSVSNYRCSTSTPGLTTNPTDTSTASVGSTTWPYCPTSPASSPVYFNSGATSCKTPPCTIAFDGNSNGQMIYSNDTQGETIYTTGPYIDALAAAGTPAATAPTGTAAGGGLPGILGETYQNIAQDMADWYGACQYEYDYDLGNPLVGNYPRGTNYGGGGWLYTCQQGDDNSTSQWAAIGLVGTLRGFGLSIPAIVQDANNVWVTNSQANESGDFPTGTNPNSHNDQDGSFGYRGDLYNSNAGGPFAVTPSGGVQMVLDGIGRTTNTAFGDASTAADQRFNNYETYYADNFCNPTSGGNYDTAPRQYTYGMFSFTKSMLLHDPNGSLTPIQYLRTLTPGVFTGDSSVPPNTIDWYAALSAANGGTDACDGIAQTLVQYQNNGGYWTAHDLYTGNSTGNQSPFETAWSIIMLQKTVFVSCVNNLAGRGSASGPFVALSWSAQTNANGYAVLRSTTTGGPYTQVGSTNLTNFRDTAAGLTAGDTYYYVVQPLQGSTEICQSNQATVLIP